MVDAVAIRSSVEVDAHRRNRQAVEGAEATHSSAVAATEAVADAHRRSQPVVVGAVATSAVAVATAGQVVEVVAGETHLAVTEDRDAKHRWTVRAVRRAAARWLVAVVDAVRVLALLAEAVEV